MRKTFSLTAPGKDPARLLETVKSDVRKYVRREQGKKLPAGMNRWDFQCRTGADAATAKACRLSDVVSAIETASHAGQAAIFVEIIASPAFRERPESTDAAGDRP